MSVSQPLEYEKRLTEISRLCKEGFNLTEIGKQLNLSRRQVGLDYNEIFRRYRKAQLQNVDSIIVEELALADWTENEAREAWERSQLNAEKEITKTGKKDKDGNGFELEVSSTVEGQYGDPRFLQIISQCSKDRRDILGVDAPKKKDESGESALAALLVSEILKDRLLVKEATNG